MSDFPTTSGNTHHTLPTAPMDTAPPLSARPYALSRQYQHLVESPAEFKSVIRDRLGRLQNTLPQLGTDQLRQARADLVYLRVILEEEDQAIAQIKAGAAWSASH